VPPTDTQAGELLLECEAQGWLTGRESPVPASRCDLADADSVVHMTLCGHSPHLGEFFILLSHCCRSLETPIPEPPATFVSGTYADGIMTITASDGDILTGTYSGGTTTCHPFELQMLRFRHDFIFTPEGTGRFESASGGGVQHGTVNRVTGRVTLNIEGVVRCVSTSLT